MTGAALDGLDGGVGHELQNVAGLQAEILHAQVAGDVVGDLAQRRA